VARVARRGADGASSFAPAMRLALRSLERPDSPAPRPPRAVPVRQPDTAALRADEPDRARRWRMELEARRAIKSGVSFHSFGIGEGPTRTTSTHWADRGRDRRHLSPRCRIRARCYCQMLAALGSARPALNPLLRCGFARAGVETAAMLRSIVLA
jgi:hypothetical protein